MPVNTLLDQLIEMLISHNIGIDQLDLCMKFDPRTSRNVSLRYKIIAVGFIREYSLDELNKKLQDHGLHKLYARNLWEATIIYAFINHLSYDNWRILVEAVLNEQLAANTDGNTLNQSRITTKLLKEYIDSNSIHDKNDLITMHQTRHLEDALRNLHDANEFLAYLRSNIEQFSIVREKTRYYICKYLYYYLESKITDYLRYKKYNVHQTTDELYKEFSIFFGYGEIKNSYSLDQTRDCLENCAISLATLYADFEAFYWGYINLDWMQALLDIHPNLLHLSPEDNDKVIQAAKAYDKKYKTMSDIGILNDLIARVRQNEIDLDQRYKIKSKKKGSQEVEAIQNETDLDQENQIRSEGFGSTLSRVGENTFRYYLQGKLDLDRTTFICLLLFLAFETYKPARLRLDKERLNTILVECGFSKLDPYNSFDFFAESLLNNDCNMWPFIARDIEKYAALHENVYLYKVYRASRNNNDDFKKVMGIQ